MKLKSILQKFTTNHHIFCNSKPCHFQHSSIKPAKLCSYSTYSKKPMSNSHSFCLSSSKIPPFYPSWAVLESPKIASFQKPPNSVGFFRPITFQGIPTKQPVYSSSSSSSSNATLQPIEELPPKLQEIVRLFQGVQEPKAKYEQLLFYGKKLEPLDARYKTRENKVQGCVSQVWVRAYFDDDKNVIFEADSDSVLTKGLAALLVFGLSGRPVEEIVRVSPDFVILLGLQQSLTPSRNNGFLNMLRLMQKKALQLYVESEKSDSLENESSGRSPDENLNENLSESSERDGGDVDAKSEDVGSKMDLGNGGVLGSRGLRIREKLESELKPLELEVDDISYQHAGHAGVRGSDGETHFNVKVVSEEFEGKSMVKRHRMIYGLLQDELQGGLHALSIVAKTPSEISA